jgi:ribosomal protein S27AE
MNQSKTLGYILIAAGAIVPALGIVWALANNLSGGPLALAAVFAAIVAIPLIGFGIYTLSKGSAEAVEEKRIKQQQKLLSMVMTQGKVDFANATIALNSTRDEVQQFVRDLVGKQLFSGYVDWDGGVLYSVDAAKIKNGQCPKCGGELELAGKGLVKCPYCGSEVFLNA